MDYTRSTQPKTKPTPKTAAVAQPPAPNPTPNRLKQAIVTLVIVVLLLTPAALAYKTLSKPTTDLVGVNQDQHQALFLTNGQVYFGKLEQADNQTLKLSDIYYLQVQQPVQPRPDTPTDQDQQAETQLIKLGEELHGPEDEMYIDRNQVLFWENLKDNGKVVEAIKEFKGR